MILRRVTAFLALGLALPGADPLYESASRKLDLIQSGHAQRGATFRFAPAEINAWVRVTVPQTVPQGVRDPRVELGEGQASGYALIDFLKIREAKGESTSWMISRLLEGERPVKVMVQLRSGGGRCTVYLTRVEISNAVANGTLLDFLIKAFLLPLYPDAKIDEPFDLDFHVERIEIHPSGVSVTMKP
jgi:hypothetical protein